MIRIIGFTLTTLSAAIVSFVVGYFFIPFTTKLNSFLLSLSKFITYITDISSFQTFIGLCTAIGSLATFGTLVYLILQNKEQKAHESKQVKMWSEQNEMLSFQKYQTHRVEFFNLISSIENRYNGIFIVKHKNRLYSRLFPKNSLVNIKYNYENEILCSDNPFLIFEDVVDAYKNETKILKLISDCQLSRVDALGVNKAVYELDLCTCKLLNLFELECILTPKLGFIHDGDFVVMDGLFPFRQIDRLISIINEIRQFANMAPYYGTGTGTGTGFYSPVESAEKVIPFYLNKNNNSTREVYGASLIVTLLDLQKLIKSLSDTNLSGCIASHIKPLDFFGYKALQDNFNHDPELVTSELRIRVKKLTISCAEEIDKYPIAQTLLAKIGFELDTVNPIINKTTETA
jgi:hypothetical protein